MTIPKQQRIAMTAIVIVGFVLGTAILSTNRDARKAETTDVAGKAGAPPEEQRVAEEATHVELTGEQVRQAGIAVAVAGPATLQVASRFPGEIRLDENRTAHVSPRAGGVVESVLGDLGHQVRTGQVLAVISSTSVSDQRSELLTAQRRRDLARTTYVREKTLWEERISAQQDYQQAEAALQEADIAVRNASQKLAAVGASAHSNGRSDALNRFDIRAPFDGTIVEKHIALGESLKEDASIFTIADLTTVWAEFAVPAQDLARVRVGQKVTVSSTAFEGAVDGTVSYVGSLLGERTRTAKARVTLTNPDSAWRPGLFVTVAVAADRQRADLAVGADAVQTIDGKTVVFVARDGGFVARPVKLGRSDGATVEVLEGLRAGDSYAATNTFVLKADLGKAGAEHGH